METDPAVQRMLQRVNENLTEIPGFGRFLQNKDDAMAKIIKKARKRSKDLGNLGDDIDTLAGIGTRAKKRKKESKDGKSSIKSGNTKALAAKFEGKGGRRSRNGDYRNGLRLPTQAGHRRRLSGQIVGSEFLHLSDVDQETMEMSASDSRNRNPAIVPGASDEGVQDLSRLREILKKEPQERNEDEIDSLLKFFKNYQIMSADIDLWTGEATFRAFISQTRYKEVKPGKYIFKEGDSGYEFYFVKPEL